MERNRGGGGGGGVLKEDILSPPPPPPHLMRRVCRAGEPEGDKGGGGIEQGGSIGMRGRDARVEEG